MMHIFYSLKLKIKTRSLSDLANKIMICDASLLFYHFHDTPIYIIQFYYFLWPSTSRHLVAHRHKHFFNLLVPSVVYSYRTFGQNFNPLVPSAHKSVRNAKILILKLEGIIKKISYERRDYESVDEKSLS